MCHQRQYCIDCCLQVMMRHCYAIISSKSKPFKPEGIVRLPMPLYKRINTAHTMKPNQIIILASLSHPHFFRVLSCLRVVHDQVLCMPYPCPSHPMRPHNNLPKPPRAFTKVPSPPQQPPLHRPQPYASRPDHLPRSQRP